MSAIVRAIDVYVRRLATKGQEIQTSDIGHCRHALPRTSAATSHASGILQGKLQSCNQADLRRKLAAFVQPATGVATGKSDILKREASS